MKEEYPMAIGITVFMVTSYVTASFLTTVFSNSAAIYNILTIVLLMGLALMFVKQTRNWAWTIFGGAIVLMVAVQVLAPYQVVLTKTIALVLTAIVTIVVKVPMFRTAGRRNRYGTLVHPTWMRWVLRLI